MIGVLELLLAVDPALDPDVAWGGLGGEADGFGDRDNGGRGEEAADTIAVAEAQQGREADGEHGDTEADEDEGRHGCR
jgi:hypothetical protein